MPAGAILVIDEVGYSPFEQDAADLFFQLVSSRYEHAPLILTSSLPFARWGDVLGDQVVASAMIDRLVCHAEVMILKSSSYHLQRRTFRQSLRLVPGLGLGVVFVTRW
ncbi:ATP-binding protein [Pseudarthrobacter sp. NPDC080039]|uniref:ATP-binding protein n=1 Tax=unclassified Pseudarthrobacter TaxID=2647000 RepID=UPI00345017BA